MPNAIVTPGYVFSATPPPGEQLTYAKLNQLGNPTVQIPAQTSSSNLNYLRNGNFYTQSWATPTGVSCPIAATAPLGTVNALYWECLPAGAAITYSQDTRVPNAQAIYSAKLTGAASATTVFLQQQIQSDFATELTQKVTFSCWIFNNTGSTISPSLNINTANVKDLWNGQSDFSLGTTANLQACGNNAWTQVSATIDLTSVTNVKNGIQVQLVFASGSLASSGQTINISELQLVIGSNVSSQFLDDYTFSLPPTPATVGSSLGYQPLSQGIINSVTNGSFDVWQNGTSYTGIGSTTKTADCWLVSAAGTMQCSFAQASSAITDAFNQTVPYMPWKPSYGLLTITTAQASLGVNDSLSIQNRIEGLDITNLAYRNLSLSFWVKSSVSGTFCASLRNSGPDRTVVFQFTISAANTWQYVTFPNIPVMNIASGTWNTTNGIGLFLDICLGTGANLQTSTTNSWISGTFFSTAAQTNLAATNGATFAVTGVQLEPGPLVSQFQYIPFDRQLLKCQRYFSKSYDYAVAVGTANANGFGMWTDFSTSLATGNIAFPAAMRAIPSTVYYNYSTGAAGGAVYDQTSATSIGSGAVFQNTSTRAVPVVSFTSGGTAGHLILGHYQADARL